MVLDPPYSFGSVFFPWRLGGRVSQIWGVQTSGCLFHTFLTLFRNFIWPLREALFGFFGTQIVVNSCVFNDSEMLFNDFEMFCL